MKKSEAQTSGLCDRRVSDHQIAKGTTIDSLTHKIYKKYYTNFKIVFQHEAYRPISRRSSKISDCAQISYLNFEILPNWSQ